MTTHPPAGPSTPPPPPRPGSLVGIFAVGVVLGFSLVRRITGKAVR